MEDFMTQNTLMKSLVATLEHQNQAKTKQIQTLFTQIDQLTAEVSRLEDELSRKRGGAVVSSDSTAKELKLLKDNNATLNRQFDGLKGKIASLTADVSKKESELRSKQGELARLNDENRRLVAQVENLRSHERTSSASSSQLITLQNEITSYKVKLSNLTTIEQELRNANSKVTTLETTNRQLVSDKARLDGEVKRVQASLQRVENENRELRVTTRNTSEISSAMSAKLSLEAEVRQLKGRVEWLQGNNKSLEQERSDLDRRLKTSEKETLDAKGHASQLRYNEETYRNIETNLQVKDKQMQALQQMINSLKDNKRYQERVIAEKDELIASLESQLFTVKSSQSTSVKRVESEVVSLRHQNEVLRKELGESLAVKGRHEMEMSRLTQREQQLMLDLTDIRNDRDRLLREKELQGTQLQEAQRELKAHSGNVSAQSYYQSYRQTSSMPLHEGRRDEQDVRQTLQRMQLEISELKQASHMQSQIINEKPHHDTHKQAFRKKSQSPSKGLHSRLLLNNERDRHGMNKVKWQNLQRKISALRTENESLKRTLFE